MITVGKQQLTLIWEKDLFFHCFVCLLCLLVFSFDSPGGGFGAPGGGLETGRSSGNATAGAGAQQATPRSTKIATRTPDYVDNYDYHDYSGF